jgi:hypothetical protein
MTEPNGAEVGTQTRLVDLKGRSITVRELKDAQQLLIQREAKILQGDEAGKDRKVTAVANIYDILESAVVQPEDLDYLTRLNVKGLIELKDMMGFITAFGEEQKPKVRRGRPPVKRS